MTAVPKDPQISELRELFKHLLELRSLYEATGVEEVSTPYGNTWSIWDLEYLYRKSQELLTRRQAQAITLCLVHNRREKDAARDMGVSETNPVMMYATLGLRRLLDLIQAGELTHFARDETEISTRLVERRLRSVHGLADRIKSQVLIVLDNCWSYRATSTFLVRSRISSSGFVAVDPRRVMFEAYVQPLPSQYRLVHRPGDFDSGCVNYQHLLIAK